MKFLVLGAAGMAGHTIALYLKERGHDVTTLTRRPLSIGKNIIGDACDVAMLAALVREIEADIVINCIGILNQYAEENMHQAVFVNSYLPHYLSYLTQNTKTRIIHMSTDCVFSGKAGNYKEDSLRDGETFYDRSKALGELENSKDLTFRNSIIGPDMNPKGIGLFNWFMQQNSEVSGYTKAIWTGVTTLTLAQAMEKAAQSNLAGLYNLVNNTTISKYELLGLFNQYFRQGQIRIQQNEKVEIDKSLLNTRKDFDFTIPSYEEMISDMKAWVIEHRSLYRHYSL